MNERKNWVVDRQDNPALFERLVDLKLGKRMGWMLLFRTEEQRDFAMFIADRTMPLEYPAEFNK